MHSDLIKFRTEPTPEIIELLDSVEYGTNGAIYRHLDTKERIKEIDNPLFLTLERHSTVIANLTFCRRDKGWYIRFFGFSKSMRASNNKKRAASNSLLRKELKNVFDDLLHEGDNRHAAPLLYAYIDPQNERSQLISSDFGFRSYTQLITQTFSRIYPKKSKRYHKISNYDEVKEKLQGQYNDYLFFHEHHIQKGPFVGLRNEKDELIAFAHLTEVHWVIKQLPGKFGKQLVKVLPYIPLINRLLKPEEHTFLVVDSVWMKHKDPVLIDELFSAILADKKLNLLIWWTDLKDPVSSALRPKIRWGLLDKMVGRTPVDVVIRAQSGQFPSDNKPVFVSAFDMV